MNSQHDYKVLLVDDDQHVLKGLEILLQDDYQTVCASSGQASIDLVKADDSIAVVVMDIKMPRMDGIEAARAMREIAPDVPVIFHTGFPGQYAEDDIDANEKPFDYVQKGSPVSRLTRAVRNAMQAHVAKKESARLASTSELTFGMIGKSRVMQDIYRLISKIAPTNKTVMILGETGTGKELAARAIHYHSKRRDRTFARLNCNHKDPGQVEAELFGTLDKIFTGVSDRVGKFEYAHEGTLFLDEIGDLDMTTQAKILQVIESGEMEKIGDPKTRKVDVRTLCATHRDFNQMVSDGTFREDLYYRLRKFVITMPALRDRREDIPHLVTRFTDRITVEIGGLPKLFDQSAMELLINHDWPGNVRELENSIERLIVLTDSHLITADDVKDDLENPTHSVTHTSDRSLAERVKEFRRNCIIEALHETDNNVNAAARLLKVDPANLRKWIKNYGIN